MSVPDGIGRYRIKQLLGRGGFGLVYLGVDDQLKREVAIKVPHAERVANAEDAELYLGEARTVANLDHGHIVPVYDVGSTDAYPVYIVSKYIEGSDLSAMMRSGRMGTRQITELVATVADAMHYAHKQGLTHRDIKPGNILLDREGRPHLVDFGLALREENVGKGPKYAGTPAYMSPEQARGEGHRVDGRSDIYSLGAVLYELLTGRRAFRGETKSELLGQVAYKDPKPPRQIDDSIPKELERICLKSLSKRAAERYTTALDLADDLKAFLITLSSDSGEGSRGSESGSRVEAGSGSRSAPLSDSGTDRQTIKVIPKGLRAFDEHDADFFLELLPGPRDREGLPDGLRFWKNRVTETDPEDTFSVGLIYGPSGCGKSSLVQAGLLPRLPSEVLCVSIEATPGETERRLLRRLRKRCAGLDLSQNLPGTLASLRRGEGIRTGQKVLIVVDQFEQWLHAREAEAHSELVQALRQCDGGNLQCLLLVRDDFWMAITRFLSDLEVDLSGHNSRAVDLFPLRHARKVLAAFGRAYGALPEGTDPSPDQKEFLKQSVASLAEEDKVTCVRLALFADMIKEKSWSPEMLKHLGGTTGVGVTFLEETFSSSAANPRHRFHEKASRAVLSALLPESGTGIRGQMKSSVELLEQSGYASRRNNFSDLIKLLDSELRLITPTDPAGRDEEDDDSAGDATYYQLTHDYLVPSLREWLTRKQRQTRRGRAELRLQERAAIWQSKPENRHLPAWWEYCSIRLLTRRRDWTAPQRKMMAKATKVQALRWGTALLIAMLMGFTFLHWKVESIVASLKIIDGGVIRPPLTELQRFPQAMVVSQLDQRFEENEQDRLPVAYALAHLGNVKTEFLVSRVEFARPTQLDNLVAALAHQKADAVRELTDLAESSTSDWHKARLAMLALRLGEPHLAQTMCRLRSNPSQRTAFIEECSSWHGNLSALAEAVVTSDDPKFRTAVALAVGSSTNVDAVAKRAWEVMLREWYTTSPDSLTHSAAGWVLRNWQLELPDIAVSQEPIENREWYLSPRGMTMLRIPHGSHVRKVDLSPDADTQTVTLTRSFYLSDREVTWQQLAEIFRDTDYPEAKKPASKRTRDGAEIDRQRHQPVNVITWYDAILFCNWLSQKEGLQPAYTWTNETTNGDADPRSVWQLNLDATGYRLPTEAEWEYACRAGTTTTFGHGNEEELLTRYAVIRSKESSRPGSKLPNAWGLFDMHGNVWEWCQDWHGPYSDDESVTDPPGVPSSDRRVVRGGAFFDNAEDVTSGHRGRYLPTSDEDGRGFRVVHTASGQNTQTTLKLFDGLALSLLRERIFSQRMTATNCLVHDHRIHLKAPRP